MSSKRKRGQQQGQKQKQPSPPLPSAASGGMGERGEGGVEKSDEMYGVGDNLVTDMHPANVGIKKGIEKGIKKSSKKGINVSLFFVSIRPPLLSERVFQ